jgi:hypothetical protein
MKDLINTKEILTQIFFIRGVKVMLDFHLASLYEVETRVLKQQVKRNIDRFPEDFMFTLTQEEWQEVITNCDNLGAYKFSPKPPFAFTEQGVSMLSSVLRSKRAISVNIAIMRAFVKMRGLIDENKEIKRRLDILESKYDRQFKIVFDAIRQLIATESKPRNPIGFRIEEKKSEKSSSSKKKD